jgi:hypothetical protein
MEIGSHTEYYKVLYNRINKQKDAINDEMVAGSFRSLS